MQQLKCNAYEVYTKFQDFETLLNVYYKQPDWRELNWISKVLHDPTNWRTLTFSRKIFDQNTKEYFRMHSTFFTGRAQELPL